MNVPFFIARRYLVPRRLSIISVIGTISVIGIVIGTAALVIVMSLFNGFRGVARDLMIGFGPHIQVVSLQGARISQADSVEALVQHRLQVPTARSISTKLVLLAGNRTGVAEAIGVRSDRHPTMAGPRQSTFLGSFTTAPYENIPSVTISSGIASGMKLYVGDTVQLMAPEMIERGLQTMTVPRGVYAVVRGIFQSNAARDVDHQRVYIGYDVAAQITRNNRPTSIDAMLAQPRLAPDLAAQMNADMMDKSGSSGPLLTVRSWEDLNRTLVDTMKLEGIGSFIVLALIILVASFNVLVSLTLGVVEKRRDIAVLLTMGLLPKDIRRVYLIQGLTLGVVSVVVGVVIGLAVCWGQITFAWIRFDMTQGYLVPALPIEVHALDVVAVALVGLVLASTAALYPASRASRTVIAEAVRVE